MLGAIVFALAVANTAFYPTLMQPFGERSRDSGEQTNATVRLTVQEAAEVLGVTVEAVRGRMHRGKYQREKDDEGRVYVLLTPNQLPNGQEEVNERSTEWLGSSLGERSNNQPRTFGPNVHKHQDAADAELVEELRGEVAYLKEIITTRDEELRRKDTIIMQMAQRIPELEAPTEPRESPQPRSEEPPPTETTGDPEEVTERRSWLYRFFFGP